MKIKLILIKDLIMYIKLDLGKDLEDKNKIKSIKRFIIIK